jgi:hypothetical protein
MAVAMSSAMTAAPPVIVSAIAVAVVSVVATVAMVIMVIVIERARDDRTADNACTDGNYITAVATNHCHCAQNCEARSQNFFHKIFPFG